MPLQGEARTPRTGMHRQVWFWLVGLAILLAVLYLLRGVLLPFVAGMAVAYLLDPLCDRLERWGLSRTWATTVITILALLLAVGLMAILVPAIVNQIAELLQRLPRYTEALRDELIDLLALIEARVDEDMETRLREALAGSAERIVAWTTGLVGDVLSGGFALANLISLLVITPVVAFYLLRDWDAMVAKVDGWLPRAHAETIREQVREVDRTLSGFLRGQGSVCLMLGTFYAVALTLAGLDFGLVIGLIAGLLSFIPYVGALIGLVLSVGVALFQFDNWLNVAIVAAIFFFGQTVEGNILTPRIVGSRVRLHPVWVIFGLLAGGALFGFVGVLLAVPTAAVIGVGARFALERYKESSYYRADGA